MAGLLLGKRRKEGRGVGHPMLHAGRWNLRGILSFLLGFTLTLGVMGTLSNCGGGGGGGGTPAPNVGQWISDTGIPITQGAHPSWAIPSGNGSSAVGYVYTQLPVAPKQGQTLVLNFSFTGNNPVFVQSGASGGNPQADINPPTIHLFLWRKGDDEACGPITKQYRMFGGRTNLVLGPNQIVSVPLTPGSWTGCYANYDTAAQMDDLLGNLLGVGITFGGQYFAGHGFYLSSGSATFTVNSFTVQ